MYKRSISIFIILCTLNITSLFAQGQPLNDEQIKIRTLHSISSHELLGYIQELTSDKYEGRLTGTEGYNKAAKWVASKLKSWGIQPLGDNNTYFQQFYIPYTLVFEGCEAAMHLPQKDDVIKKYYHFDDDFIPGSTSGSGEITAEVIFAGYGITAPELNYDDYKDVDVKDKIILIEREVPVSTRNPEQFKKWRPYSFHQYKLENAVKHGAKGMLYNYGPIANPNNAYDANFIYSHVGNTVVKDVFAGTNKNHKDVVDKIKQDLKPQSFNTKKIFTIKNNTEHHPEGKGSNVIGILYGSDPQLKDEVIILGGHLDHMGKCPEIMPGANDNCSGTAIILGVAKALAESNIQLKRSVMFLNFGAEEQAVVGSKYYLENPKIPLNKTVCFLNLDGVGCGHRINGTAGRNFPELWNFIKNANERFVHRQMNANKFANIARPRLDAARFMWADVPTISFSVSGSRSFYHNTKDDISTITPEILEDLAQILFLAIIDIANQDQVNFRK